MVDTEDVEDMEDMEDAEATKDVKDTGDTEDREDRGDAQSAYRYGGVAASSAACGWNQQGGSSDGQRVDTAHCGRALSSRDVHL